MLSLPRNTGISVGLIHSNMHFHRHQTVSLLCLLYLQYRSAVCTVYIAVYVIYEATSRTCTELIAVMMYYYYTGHALVVVW